jgi:hypothetical protein
MKKIDLLKQVLEELTLNANNAQKLPETSSMYQKKAYRFFLPEKIVRRGDETLIKLH